MTTANLTYTRALTVLDELARSGYRWRAFLARCAQAQAEQPAADDEPAGAEEEQAG